MLKWEQSAGTCQYPLVMSIFVRNLARPNRSTRSSMHGKGKGSASVYLFTLRKSTHRRVVPSGFGTKTIEEAQPFASLCSGLISSIIPIWSTSFSSFLTRDFFSGLSLYGGDAIRFASLGNCMMCTHSCTTWSISKDIRVCSLYGIAVVRELSS